MSETGRCRVHVPEGATPKDGPSARRRLPRLSPRWPAFRVRTENSILIDYMTESPNVSGDDRSAILLPDAVRLAERRSLVLHPDGKEQGIFSSE